MSYITDSIKDKLNRMNPLARLLGLGTLMKALETLIETLTTNALNAGIPFCAVATLGKADTTGKTIVTAVTGKTIVVTGFSVLVDGATAWADTTATKITIQDTATSPIAVAEVAKAGLTANAILGPCTTNVTLKSGFSKGKLTLSKGLVVKPDAEFASGSDLKVTVWGFLV